MLVTGLHALAAYAEPDAAPWSAKVHCAWNTPNLHCQFRPLTPVTIQGVELAVDGASPQVIGWQPFASDGATSVMLWLVDVSNPARAATVARQQQLLTNWATTLRPWQQAGLAVFAENLEMLAPLDSTLSTLTASLEQLVARGHSTAFYRSLLDGIALLARASGERKSLWVFSDAMAEDTAYRYDDVLQAARAANIMVIGLGYPEKDSQRPALQRLQRLAEETGGYFAAAPTKGTVSSETFAEIMAITEGGGSFTQELPRLDDELTLRLIAADSVLEKTFRAQELTTTQSSGLSASPSHDQAPTTAPSSENADSAPDPAPYFSLESVATWLWWVGLGIAAVVLLSVLFVIVRRVRATQTPLLALIEQPDSGQEFPIYSAAYRIGRAADNNLQLENDSVSAYHAELQQRRDGVFSISDLDSTNGVLVNGEQISSQVLRDGDLIELGEVRLRFREAPPWGSSRP